MWSCFISEASRYFTTYPFSLLALLTPPFSTLEETSTESLHLLQLKDNTTLVLTNYSQLPQHSSSFLSLTLSKRRQLYTLLWTYVITFWLYQTAYFSTFVCMSLLLVTAMIFFRLKVSKCGECVNLEKGLRSSLFISKEYGQPEV